jgi:hypothetical protein
LVDATGVDLGVYLATELGTSGTGSEFCTLKDDSFKTCWGAFGGVLSNSDYNYNILPPQGETAYVDASCTEQSVVSNALNNRYPEYVTQGSVWRGTGTDWSAFHFAAELTGGVYHAIGGGRCAHEYGSENHYASYAPDPTFTPPTMPLTLQTVK